MPYLDTLLDPGRRAEAAREQASLLEEFGHKLNKHPAEQSFLYGVAREQLVMPAIEDIYSGVNQPDPCILPDLLEKLAEGYALQSRFSEAAQVTANPAREKEYAAKAQAVANVGVRQCACPPVITRRSPNDAKGKNYPSSTVAEEVCDGKRIIALTRCALCHVLSARYPS